LIFDYFLVIFNENMADHPHFFFIFPKQEEKNSATFSTVVYWMLSYRLRMVLDC